MKKKELQATLQVTKAYNDLLIQMLQQSQKQSSNGITDAFATDNQEYESLEEKSQYLDQLEENGRYYSEQKRRAGTLRALYEEQLRRADKGKDTTDKKLKKAIHKLDKENADLRNNLTTMQIALKKEERQQKKLKQEVKLLTQIVQYILWRAGILKYNNTSLKGVLKECKRDDQELRRVSYPAVACNNKGGQDIWDMIKK